MECVILYRNKGGGVEFVAAEHGSMFVFSNDEEADEYIQKNALFQSGQVDFQIVELNEL